MKPVALDAPLSKTYEDVAREMQQVKAPEPNIAAVMQNTAAMLQQEAERRKIIDTYLTTHPEARNANGRNFFSDDGIILAAHTERIQQERGIADYGAARLQALREHPELKVA